MSKLTLPLARRETLPNVTADTTKTKEIWDNIRLHRDKVSWHKVIWFPLHIPKLSIISWMAILDHLPTRDRLIRMRIITDSLCILCNEDPESRNHLFVDCIYATSLWNSIMNLSSMRYTHRSWESRIEWATQTWKGKSLLSIILRIAWTAFIYFIWEERNRRLFNRGSRTADQLLTYEALQSAGYLARLFLNTVDNPLQWLEECLLVLGLERFATLKPPSVGVVKLNFDGSLDPTTGSTTVGIIA
ncbi:uncharacterized protein LOC120136880 [Hibiscus syriacus]|uniref:uncharacterized protein LOC120136880 n=1 Tax=Hibiscus syriacus TaxID=106335 RepID=UPI0019223975|nr:uncharacterized protein LOC120136880 [Hibiscus syriacus]